MAFTFSSLLGFPQALPVAPTCRAFFGSRCKFLCRDWFVAFYAKLSTKSTGLLYCLLYPFFSHHFLAIRMLSIKFGYGLPAAFAAAFAADFFSGLNFLCFFAGLGLSTPLTLFILSKVGVIPTGFLLPVRHFGRANCTHTA